MIVNTLLSNAAFRAWKMATFGGYGLVMDGYENAKPPDPTTTMPWTIINSAQSGDAEDGPEISTAIGIHHLVVNETKTETSEKIIYEGKRQVEELRSKAETAILTEKNQLGTTIKITGGYDDDSIHPLHRSYSIVTVIDDADNTEPFA